MFILFSVSSVCAIENDTLMTDDAGYALSIDEESVSEDEILSTYDDEIINRTEDNDVLSESGTFSELRSKINEDPVELILEKDYVSDGSGPISLSKKILQIDSQGHSIDGKGMSGIFKSEQPGIHIGFKNIVFKNGKAENGGAIHVKAADSYYTIENCTFLNNMAEEDGGAIYFESNNGGLEISDSKFEKNKALYDSFHDSDGGAINCQKSELVIDNCNFKSNSAYGYGGVIYYYSIIKELTILNSKFQSNQAFKHGGAIFIHGKVKELKNSTFHDNLVVDKYGGAIYIDSNINTPFTVDSCTFTLNKAVGSGVKAAQFIMMLMELFLKIHFFHPIRLLIKKEVHIHHSVIMKVERFIVQKPL